MAEIEKHKRVHDTFTGPVERKALAWLAARMPAWVTPDVLTAIGVVGSLLVFGGYWLTHVSPAFLWLANLGFLINWFGDSLDGTLARFRKIERPKYGFYIDHTVDAFSEALVFLGAGMSIYLDFRLAALAVIGYFMVSVVIYVQTAVEGLFKISYSGLGPTEVRIIAVVVNTYLFFFGSPGFTIRSHTIQMFDVVAIVIAVVLFIIYFTSMFGGIKRLKDVDRKES